MRTDLKVGVISLFALVVACVLFFAWHSNKPGKDVGVATPARTGSTNGNSSAMSVGAPADAPTTAPSAAVALPAPSVSAFGPSHALGADTYTGPTIAPPSPTTAPSSTSLIPPTGATGLSAPGSSGGLSSPGGLNSSNSFHQPLSGGSTGLIPPGNTGLSTGSPSLLPPSTGPGSVNGGMGNLSGTTGNTGFGTGNTSSLTPRPSSLEIGTPSSSGSTHTSTHGSSMDIPGFGTSSSGSLGGGSTGGTYAIQKGDTLAALAKKNHTTTKAIVAANPGVNPNRLKVGQKIKMPEPGAASTSGSTGLGGSTSIDTFGGAVSSTPGMPGSTATTRPASTHRGSKGAKSTRGAASGSQSSLAGGTYTIKKGDTLRKIAKSVYGNEKLWARIFRANRGELSSPNALKVGQTIHLPK